MIPTSDLFQIWDTYKEKTISLKFHTTDKIYIYKNPSNDALESTLEKKEDLEKIADKVSHISIDVLNEEVEPLYQTLSQTLPLKISIMKSASIENYWLEIHSKNVTKYQSLNKLSQSLKISNKDIVAFGDSYNDIELIKNCGVGIAMKNAVTELQKEADFITEDTNKEDGVYRFLVKYIKENP